MIPNKSHKFWKSKFHSCWHENSSGGSGVRIVNFSSTVFLHINIYENIWASPDGKTCSQIDHILAERRWYSSILDVQHFRGTDWYRRPFLIKLETENFDVKRFILKKINRVEVVEQYLIKISDRLAALGRGIPGT